MKKFSLIILAIVMLLFTLIDARHSRAGGVANASGHNNGPKQE